MQVRIAQAEEEFWKDIEPIDGSGVTKYELRNVLLRDMPVYRDRGIAEDFTTELNAALYSASVKYVEAAVILTRVRYSFFALLQRSGQNFAHINTFEMESMSVYWKRLMDRLDQCEKGFVTDKRVQHTVFPRPAVHLWLN